MSVTPGAHARTDADPVPPSGSPSVGELLSEITQDVSTLMRQEVALAKAELRQSATQAGKGAGMLGGAAVFGHLALLFLAIAGWWGLGDAIGRAWAGLVVMAIAAVIAGVLAQLGRKELQATPGVPQTASTLKQVPNAVKGNEGSNR